MDLFYSVKKGDLDSIKAVTAVVLFNATDECERTVLSAAARYDKFDCFKEILNKCPSLLFIQDPVVDYTVLHDAVEQNNYVLVDYIVSVGSRGKNILRLKKWIKLKNNDSDTALTMATIKQNVHIVERLIQVDREYKLGLSETVGRDSQTALQLAVKYQAHEIIKMLTGRHDNTPYFTALDLLDHVKNGDFDYIKHRTQSSAGLDRFKNARDIYRNSALCIATKWNQFDCCEEILKICPMLLYHQNSFKETALHHATHLRNGNYRFVDLFVGVGLDGNMQDFKNWINSKNHIEDTALIQAVNNHNHDIVKIFLKVDRQYKLGLLEITGSREMTPLQLVLEYEDQEMIKLLTEGTDPDFEHGANTDGDNSDSAGTDTDTDDKISLSVATTQAQEALPTGNNSNSAGNTPLQLVLEYEDQEMIKLLTEDDFEDGANTDGDNSDYAGTDTDTDDNISLSVATTQAQEALPTGNNSNSAGNTPLQLVLEYEDQEMIKLLTEGTDPDLEDGANTDGDNSDSAGKDAINDFEKIHHTSLATNRMEDFSVGEFDKNSSTDSTTRLLYNLANEKPRPYSYAQLMEFTKELSDPVGSGGFGDVYKGELPNGALIAVKILKNSQPELMKKQFEAEVGTMGRTYHGNLIKLYGHCYEVDKKALIYEYMEEGDLHVILNKKCLDMVKLYTIATEIARGISYLHEHCNPPIVHHDLKPANVLLDSKFSPRVIDFGLATFNLEKSKSTDFRCGGSHGYIAPEIALRGLGRITSKCDVFSFGMILFDILKSQLNYVDERWLPGLVGEKFNENKLGNFLKEHGIKEDDEAKAKTLSMVALSCSEHYPKKRPSMSSVVKMFEGDMTPCPSANPFPYYESSMDCNE